MTHVMLSYQWDKQDLVKKVYDGLREHGINAWMDIKGGIKGNINESMAHGVDNAAVICCFMTPKYMESKNCKKELNYADGSNKPIVPVMCEQGFKATGWLGIITAGLLWIDFRDPGTTGTSIQSLAEEVMHATESEGAIKLSASQKSEAAKTAHAPPKEVKKNPGRAFRHNILGKFLAESGDVKYHQASGSRSTLVLKDKPEETSYWVEERDKSSHGIFYYKNKATQQYLGFDPNGNYVYTKGQHYGAEQWNIVADETWHDGKRAVVLFAVYGKKYLTIKNGKLTGVNSKDKDCVWILE